MEYRLEKSVFFKSPVENVFLYHACVDNISRIVPGHVRLKILEAPCSMKKGDVIRIKVSLYKIGFLWETEITEYVPGEIFVDFLKKGPFSYWRHRHLFKPCGPGTVMTDIVDYSLPCGILGSIAEHIFVRKELERIFGERHRRAAQLL